MGRPLLILLIVLALSLPAAAEPLILCVDDWHPYEYSEDGRLRGVYGETAELVLQSMGQEIIEVLPVAWRRALNMIEEGGCHGLVSAFKAPERTRYALYPDEPFGINDWQFYVRKGRFKDRSFLTLDDLDGLTIGTIYDWAYPTNFLAFAKNNHDMKPSSSTERNFELLLADRLDVVLEDGEVGDHIVRELGATGSIVHLKGIDLREKASYMIFSRARVSPELVKRFSRALKTFKKTKAYSSIRKKYLN